MTILHNGHKAVIAMPSGTWKGVLNVYVFDSHRAPTTCPEINIWRAYKRGSYSKAQGDRHIRGIGLGWTIHVEYGLTSDIPRHVAKCLCQASENNILEIV